ncbi:MAG: hypothetical protein PUD43_04495, partial [Clostridia bacterium]|nr:hypothetical protein [Clostridia bacterium]
MKKKLALLMAAIMTVAMVPMTAFASTKLTAVDEILTAVDKAFVSRVELVKNDDQVDIDQTKYANGFDVTLELTNGKFIKNANDVGYTMDTDVDNGAGVIAVKVNSDTKATVTLSSYVYNGNGAAADACVLDIKAKAVEAG